MNQKYRLYRHDPANIALQRKTKAGWATIGYGGNNARSIARLLAELAVTDWRPGPVSLARQIADLQRVIETHAEVARQVALAVTGDETFREVMT